MFSDVIRDVIILQKLNFINTQFISQKFAKTYNCILIYRSFQKKQ